MVDTKAPEKVAEAVKDGAPTTAATPAATTEIPAPATTLAPEPSNGLLSAQHWAEIAPPEITADDDDLDSALGDDNASSTASISSSILNYRTMNGRTYHSERGNANYWTPNDSAHAESMDINHHVLTLVLDNKLFLAPVKSGIEKALDVGTGTGIWAIDFGDAFPDTEVIGTDISPIQPTWVPPNVKFEIDDCTLPWTFPANSFDYVHLRFLYGSIDNWDNLFAEAFRVCKPGGWVESHEASPRMESDDVPVAKNAAMHEWGKFFVEGGKKLGRTFTIIDDDLQRKGATKAGFVNLNTWDFKAPIGPWPTDRRMNELGRYAQAALEQDYEGYLLYMASLQGWNKDEVTVYCAHLKQEIRSGKHHPFYRQRVVWAQKPE